MSERSLHNDAAMALPRWGEAVERFTRSAIDLIAGAAPGINASVEQERQVVAELLGRVDADIAAADPFDMPVCRFMEQAIQAAPRGDMWQAGIADACAHVAPGLHWRNKYRLKPEYEALFRGFAFCDLVGPDGSQPSADVTLGLVLLGPETFYPFHHHPARELYYVVSGTVDWAVDMGSFESRPPGSFILHEENRPHAMRTGQEPLLAISVWRGAIREPSCFSV